MSRIQGKPVGRGGGWLLVWTLASLLPPISDAIAGGIATDGSTGAQVELTGSDMVIDEGLGRRAGGNLFHGFERFNIATGGRAEFRGGSDVKRVIARVSGGEVSSIDGTLALAIPNADLWFFNPAGVLLGAGARFELGGDLFLATGDHLDFADATRWLASGGQDFGFTVAEPTAFGFLPDNAAALDLRGSRISLADGRAASLSARQIELAGARLDWRNATLRLDAGAGRIGLTGASEMIGAGRDARVSIIAGKLEITEASRIVARNDEALASAGAFDIAAAAITINSGASVVSESVGGGAAAPIDIVAGTLDLDGFGFISSNARADGGAGAVSLRADRIVIGGGSFISSETFAGGSAGDLLIDAGSLELVGDPTGAFTGITSQAAAGSLGNAGDVRITADDLSLRFGVLISSDTFAQGDAGAVRVDAGRVLVAGEGAPVFTAIASLAFPGALGSAGRVEVDAMDIQLREGGQITAAAFGEGAGGDVKVETGTLTIASSSPAVLTGISSDTALGEAAAGDVLVIADRLDIRGPGVISSTTFSGGDAGTVEVRAGVAKLDGEGRDGFSGITSQANAGSSGDAGEVRVVADDLQIRNGSTINSSTFGGGDAGFVRVEAKALTIAVDENSSALGATGIFSDAQADSLGDAGQVEVAAGELTLGHNGQISSQTLSVGDAGAIAVDAGSLRVTGGDIVSSTSGSGAAGSVRVSADRIEVLAEGSISSRSQGTGPAGDIDIAAGSLRVTDASIATSGRDSAGGRIDIAAMDGVLIENSTVTSNGIRPAAGASLITISASEIVLNRSRVESLFDDGDTVQVETIGNSGEANLFGKVTIISTDSVVAAGTSVDVTGLDSDIGTDLLGGDVEFAGRNEALSNPCTAAVQGQVSSFQLQLGAKQRRASPDAPLSGCPMR